METTSAEVFFNSLESIESLEQLIEEGEFENQYLECKAPSVPLLNTGLKQHLSEAISGFANSGGGVIIWGMSTTKQAQTGVDVLTQVEELGSIHSFQKQVDSAIPTLSIPQVDSCKTKILKRKNTDTRGVLVVLIAPTKGDPIQSRDGKFYLRIKDEFKEMPYETVKRMFSGSAGPDLEPVFDARIVKLNIDGSWEIPIIIRNASSAAAKETEVSLIVNNEDSCEKISSSTFQDVSHLNPGMKIFMRDVKGLIYRGKDMVVGNLNVKMKKGLRAKRKLDIRLEIFSSNMRAKSCSIIIQLAKKGFSVKKSNEHFLY